MTTPKSSLIRTFIAGPLGVPRPAREPDSCEIAAWLEGRLSDEEAAGVEAWLTQHPEWRQALAMLPEALPQELSAAATARARKLLPATASRSTRRGTEWRWAAWLGWVPAFGLSIALVVGGFVVGSELGADEWRRDAAMLAQILSGWSQ